MQDFHEQVECLRQKLGQAGEAHRLVRQECAREMAAARVAWDLRRRKELQVMEGCSKELSKGDSRITFPQSSHKQAAPEHNRPGLHRTLLCARPH